MRGDASDEANQNELEESEAPVLLNLDTLVAATGAIILQRYDAQIGCQLCDSALVCLACVLASGKEGTFCTAAQSARKDLAEPAPANELPQLGSHRVSGILGWSLFCDGWCLNMALQGAVPARHCVHSNLRLLILLPGGCHVRFCVRIGDCKLGLPEFGNAVSGKAAIHRPTCDSWRASATRTLRPDKNQDAVIRLIIPFCVQVLSARAVV
jgi:hypothetical protein